jgi:hypothetical protein
MTERDSLDERATALFEAARRERASQAGRARALTAALAATSIDEGEAAAAEPAPSAGVVRLGRRGTYGMAVALALVAAVTAVIVWRAERGVVSLSPSPEHGTASVEPLSGMAETSSSGAGSAPADSSSRPSIPE